MFESSESRLTNCQTVLEYISSANEPFVESVKRVGLVSMPPKSLQDLFAWNVARREAATAYKDLWLENNLDAILNTLAPHTAPPLDTWPGITQALWNLVDYPSCIIPTGKVGPGDVTDNAAKYGPDDEKVYAMYTGPDNYQGAPTTLQLVGMRQEDENLVAMAGIVDKILNNS